MFAEKKEKKFASSTGMPERRKNGKPFFGRAAESKEEFESKLLDLTRLAHMKAGGRRFRFRAVMIIGGQL